MQSTLQDRIDEAVRANPHLAGRRLRLESNEGRVVLSGHVGTYFQKQMAQEAIKRVDGVHEIENRLEVTL